MTIVNSEARLGVTVNGQVTDFDLDALQGSFSVEQYLRLSDKARHLLEFTDGVIEVLPMPTTTHQAISATLFLSLRTAVSWLGGAVFYAPLRLRVRPDAFREPDLLVLLDKHDPRLADRYWTGADLVVEIVSRDEPTRDTVDKPLDYAACAVPEYWIVDPRDETVTVLRLADGRYATTGVFRRGERVRSPQLPTLDLPVEAVFAAV